MWMTDGSPDARRCYVTFIFGSSNSVDITRHLRIGLLRSHKFRENRRKKGRAVFWPLLNYACTVQPYDVSELKNASAKSVNCTAGQTISCLIPAQSVCFSKGFHGLPDETKQAKIMQTEPERDDINKRMKQKKSVM